MKKIYSFITSLPFMSFLFILLAFSMAIATFIESSYGTPTAKAIVYNTHWFELLWALFALNLLNNIFVYRFFTKRRFTIGIFHVSFLLILLGAAITRYFSFEGVMHIRENTSSDYILSSDDYFYAGFKDQEKEKHVRFSELTPKKFSATFDVNGTQVKVKSVGYISDAERTPVASGSGEAIIDFVFSTPSAQGMQSYFFTEGNLLDYPGFVVGFENDNNSDIKFFTQNNQLFLTSAGQIDETTMATQETVTFDAGDTIPVKNMFLYQFGDFQFLIRNFYPSATFTAVKSQNQTFEDAVMVQISDDVRTQTVPVFGHSGVSPDTLEVPLGDDVLRLAYGAFPIHVPFSIYLKDFQLERYPGSNSPSSFASEVTLIDPNKGLEEDHRIFMNNTLVYKGYKFFQSSYDQDEGGTVLSVNHDFAGTNVTYLGYALLILGIFLSLVNKNSYFRSLIRRLQQNTMKSAATVLLLVGISVTVSAQTGIGSGIPSIDGQLVEEFSKLWVQGTDGRIEPLSTLNSEIVRKVTKKSSLYGKKSDEVILSMMSYPEMWQTMPVIRVSDKELAAELGISGNSISLQQIFDQQGNYRIAENVRAAYAKMPAFRNQLDKEYINLDERVNVCFMVFSGSIFQIYPRVNRDDPWYAPGEVAEEYSGGDSIFVKSGFQYLLQSVTDQQNTEALQTLQAVANFQQKYGADLLPSQSKKNIEILYNKINPFKRIFPYYLMFGFFLLIVLFINIFRLKPLPRAIHIVFFGIIFILFLIHTIGLITRWYISGHAPWSNGYESVVYVAWAAMLAGLIFGRKYPMVVGTAAFLSGIALLVAHMSWMNPEVTNLVPVLKSYWLAIHVAIITASYGFLGLSFFLGIIVMVLIILRRQHNEVKVSGFIEQITTINEMSATVGLYFLTIGTFLGGIWANESWGRYWGWDPKETWALISVVVYSFIAHMRLIPSFKGIFNYNLASIAGYASIMMTYFGVNYFLSGLHSYGKGVVDGINPAVPVTIILIAGIIVWAYMKESKFKNRAPDIK